MTAAFDNMFDDLKSLGEREEYCGGHGPYQSQGSSWRGRESWSTCPKCDVEKSQREQQERFEGYRQEREAKQLEALLGRAGIPKRFADKSFAGYRAESDLQLRALKTCKDYADEFEQRLEAGANLILCGKPGTGKTHLACAIANQVVRDLRRPVVFARVFDAIRTVKATWARDSQMTETEAIQTFVAPDLLILDEVGVQFGSEAEMLLAFEIINGRYEAVKPTILLSNLSINELKVFLGERVMDRLREGGGKHLVFDWASHRGIAA